MRFLLIALVAIFLVTSLAFAEPAILQKEPAILQKITTSSGDAAYRVFFKTKGKLEYTSSLQQNPLRIVLDFRDTDHKLTSKVLVPKENPYLSYIRIKEQGTKGENSFQLILDLKSNYDYSFSPDPEGFMLLLTPPVPKTATSIPKVPTSVEAAQIKQSPLPLQQDIDIHIGVEDLVTIAVFELSQFDVEARVAGDGTITMPLVGTIEIRGLTKKEAEKKITAALEAKFVNNPSVSVNIKEYKSKQVSVLGGVANPGPYYILNRRTLIQLISEAGGLTEQAGKKCFIFRQGSPKIELDLEELMKSGDPSLNIAVLPGDVVHIPPIGKIVVYVLGAVKTPGAVELSTDMPITLVAAIAKAGGLDEGAKSKIQITRKDENGKQLVLKADFKDILKGKTPDLNLIQGDVITVPESFF